MESVNYKNEFSFNGKVKPEIMYIEKILSSDYEVAGIDDTLNIYRTSIADVFSCIDTVKDALTDLGEVLSKVQGIFYFAPEDFLISLVKKTSAEGRSDVVSSFREAFWQHILKQTRIEEYLFSEERALFYSELSQNFNKIPLTKDNVLEVFKNIYLGRGFYLKKAVARIFDEITSHHSASRFHREDWQARQEWMIDKKMTARYAVRFNYGRFGVNDTRWIADLDRLVRYVDRTINGSCVEEDSISDVLESKFNLQDDLRRYVQFDNTAETPYFKLRFFKNESLRIEFKDKKICDQVNCLGWQVRKALGYDTFGKEPQKIARAMIPVNDDDFLKILKEKAANDGTK